MKVCCSSRSHSRTLQAGDLTQLEWIDMCANELAFDGVDFFAAHFPRTDADYLAQLKKLCVDRCLTIAAVTFDAPVGADVDRDIRAVSQWLEFAGTLGAPLLRIETAAASGAPGIAWRGLIRGLKEISAAAKRVNVTLALEPKTDTLVGSAPDVKRVLKECDSAWLRLALPARRLGADDAESWAQLAGDAVVAVADVGRLDMPNLDTGGGDEALDYRRPIDMLARLRYRGFVTLEYAGNEPESTAVVRVATWLRRVLAKEALKDAAMEA